MTPDQVAEATDNDAVYLVPPVIAELEYGVQRAQTEAQRNRRLAAVAKIKRKPSLMIDNETGEIFGRLAEYLDREGRPARHRVHDLWISALAIQYGYRVLTQNQKDFVDVPGVDVLAID
jgi:predicted nucleic acid-binding protein